MIVLTNCLSLSTDEGGLKVAHSLAERIKRKDPQTTLVSYGEKTGMEDVWLPVNKLMLSGRLAGLLRRETGSILYMPQYARMLPMALRAFVLSRYTRKNLWVLLSMKSQMGRFAQKLLTWSRARVIAVSEESWLFFREIIGDDAYRLRTGVDMERFSPVCAEKKRALREKYGIPQDKKVVLHVGHMARGRNVAMLASLDEQFHAVLAVSTKTKAYRDEKVYRLLKEKSGVTIFDTYNPDIQELYQMADVYLFPVREAMNCIDIPLSVLEAAACGLPVVTTRYGELAALMDQEGFYEMDSFEPAALNARLEQAIMEKKSPRGAVLPYDWETSADHLIGMIRTTEN